eukprot:1200348-Rhodomonas_salina.1
MMLADIKKKEVMIHKVIIDEPEEELGRTGSGAGVIERTPSLIKMVESGFFATAVRTHSLPTELSYEEALTRGDHLRKQRQRLQKLMLGGQYGEELLSLAVSNDLAGVKRLLVMGAPVNVQDGGLRTPLHWAAAMGNTSIVSVLISYGETFAGWGRLRAEGGGGTLFWLLTPVGCAGADVDARTSLGALSFRMLSRAWALCPDALCIDQASRRALAILSSPALKSERPKPDNGLLDRRRIASASSQGSRGMQACSQCLTLV